MARIGSFAGPEVAYYGAPLETVHPANNKFPLFDPEIEGLTGLSLAEKAKMQAELDELAAALIVIRDTANRS